MWNKFLENLIIQHAWVVHWACLLNKLPYSVLLVLGCLVLHGLLQFHFCSGFFIIDSCFVRSWFLGIISLQFATYDLLLIDALQISWGCQPKISSGSSNVFQMWLFSGERGVAGKAARVEVGAAGSADSGWGGGIASEEVKKQVVAIVCLWILLHDTVHIKIRIVLPRLYLATNSMTHYLLS